MILNTKLLFVVILAIASSRFEVVAGTDDQDDDDILKQALFLVELLKSDFSQVLRSNSKHDPKGSSAEEANSTCGLDETNSTVAMYETEVTESGNSSTTPAVSTSTPSSGSVTPPGVQMMMFSSWPPLPMPRFPMVSELARQGNFPDENYRFPNNSPLKTPGNFRRVANNDSIGDPSYATATPQAQTTSNIISSRPSAENTSKLPESTPSSQATPASTGTVLQMNLSRSTQANTSTAKDSLLLTIIPPVQNAIPSIPNKSLLNAKKSIHDTIQTSQSRTASTEAASASTVYHTDSLRQHTANRKRKKKDSTKTSSVIKSTTESTTMKIFLGKSSRLPIPLSENNAFCYFHPNNPLCSNA